MGSQMYLRLIGRTHLCATRLSPRYPHLPAYNPFYGYHRPRARTVGDGPIHNNKYTRRISLDIEQVQQRFVYYAVYSVAGIQKPAKGVLHAPVVVV